ncbi:MAG: TonB-dependent receptor [Marinifilum sp.]|jgi:TonB-linked SusC/RagA family outer membrane protein|nr:TonB-dependent receptor [Marinifilum sp.]
MKKKRNSIYKGHKRLLSFLLMICLSLPSFAGMQKGKVNLRMESVSVQEVIEEIGNQIGIGFLYRGEELKNHMLDKVNYQGNDWEEVVTEILEPLGKTFKVEKDLILIVDKSKEIQQSTKEQQEKKSIKGKVSDTDGIPLPGVSVVIKGTNTGVATNIDGNYTIEIEDEDAILVFSFVGMLPQEIAYNGQSVQNVILVTDSEQMQEVVVVGYGSQKKERIGSAITQVDADEIEERAAGAISIEQIIGGQIKGVQISQSSGAPGAESTIRVRGITSPFVGGNNQPLYVIDGVIMNTDAEFDVGTDFSKTENPLLGINPSDIESFSVLKDAGATAIYGSRGANGVIIINTKRGKKNSNIRVSLDYNYSVANPVNTLDVLDAEGFKKLHTMVANNTMDAYLKGYATSSANRYAGLILDPDTREVNESIFNYRTGENMPVFGDANTDWQEELYKNNAGTHQLNLNMAGGNNKTSYSFSLNHTDQEGMIVNDELKRYGARLALDSDIKEWLKIGATLNYSHTNNFNGGSSTSPTEAAKARPDYGVYADNGEFQRIPYSWSASGTARGYNRYLIANPLAQRENRNTKKSSSFNGNAYLEIKPIKDLKLRTDVSIGDYETISEFFTPIRATALRTSGVTQAYLNNSISETGSVVVNLQANYNKVISNIHNLDLMAGYSVDRRYFYRESSTFSDFLDDDVLTNATSAGAYNTTYGGKAESGINSFYTRLQYSYGGKYTATLNFRTDESSKFGPGNKRAYFPSLAMNWNIANEEFMKEVSFVDLLKLRGSYGKTGSANVSDFSYLQRFLVGSGYESSYVGNNALINSPTFPNRNIKWETTKEFNIGLDFALFENRIQGSVDLYDKYTDGILMPAPILLESGAEDYTDNLAEVSNKGLELELSGDFIRTNDFTWSANFNIAFNRNKIENIKGNSLKPYQIGSFVEGEPIGAIQGYKVEKIIQSEEEINALNEKAGGRYYRSTTGPGDYLYKDTNGDNKITFDDRVVLGNMQPDFFGGFSTNIMYKGFNLGAFFQYSVGNEKIWSNNTDLLGRPTVFQNMIKEALTDTWTPENKDAKYSRLIYSHSYNIGTHERSIQDASYLRLKVLRLSYDLPKELIQKIEMEKVQFYISASNLFTITNYDGLDPESTSSTYITAASRSIANYPFAKTVTLGVSVNF